MPELQSEEDCQVKEGEADARRRMLEREQDRRKSESAAEARRYMIQRAGKGT